MRLCCGSYFRDTSLRDVPEKRTVGRARRAPSQQPRGTCYGTMPCTFMEQYLPPSHSSGGTHSRFFPPDQMGEMKSLGQTTSTIHLCGSSGRRILPVPDSTRMTPRLYATLAVRMSLGSLEKTSRFRLTGARTCTSLRSFAP